MVMTKTISCNFASHYCNWSAESTRNDDDELMFITLKGVSIRIKVSDFKNIGRNTSGIRLIKLGEGDRVVSIAKVVSEE